MEQLDTLFSLKQSYEADFEKNNETLSRVEEAIKRKYLPIDLYFIIIIKECHLLMSNIYLIYNHLKNGYL